MKPFVAVFASLICLAGALDAHAQADIMIKQKAKALGNQPPPRNPAPAAPTAAQPAAPTPAPVPAPSGPPLTTQQLQLIDKMAAELTGIKAGAAVTAEQKQSLEGAATALAKGAAKPSKESLAKLSGDLSSALAGKDVTTVDRSQLAKAINVVVNSGSMTTQQTQSALNAAQNGLKAGNVGDAELKTVMADLHSIVLDLQKNKSSLYR